MRDLVERSLQALYLEVPESVGDHHGAIVRAEIGRLTAERDEARADRRRHFENAVALARRSSTAEAERDELAAMLAALSRMVRQVYESAAGSGHFNPQLRDTLAPIVAALDGKDRTP